jgi:hypothetical protein
LIEFFDTSALLMNYVRETGTQAVRAAVHAAPAAAEGLRVVRPG